MFTFEVNIEFEAQFAIFRPEMVVGWYHSHPGFGCWLSGVDINTQQSFEALSERAVAVVVDPIQSVKGTVKILLPSKSFLTKYSLIHANFSLFKNKEKNIMHS